MCSISPPAAAHAIGSRGRGRVSVCDISAPGMPEDGCHRAGGWRLSPAGPSCCHQGGEKQHGTRHTLKAHPLTQRIPRALSRLYLTNFLLFFCL